MGEPSTAANSASENFYPPSYEALHQYEPTKFDTTPVLDPKLAHVDDIAASDQSRHTTVDFEGAQARTSSGRDDCNAAANYLYIDARSDVWGEYIVDTDLAPLPGRFNSDEDRKVAENVYISVAAGASLNVKLCIQGNLPAKVVLAAHRNHNAPLPHCVEIVSNYFANPSCGQKSIEPNRRLFHTIIIRGLRRYVKEQLLLLTHVSLSRGHSARERRNPL